MAGRWGCWCGARGRRAASASVAVFVSLFPLVCVPLSLCPCLLPCCRRGVGLVSGHFAVAV